MARLPRVALVLLGLVAAGGLLGALAAGGALACSYMLRGLWEPYFYGDAVSAAWLGGTLGAVLGPACALGFLRRLPLWLALVGPTAATFLGGVIGELLRGSGLLTAPGAFLLAVTWLHFRSESYLALSRDTIEGSVRHDSLDAGVGSESGAARGRREHVPA